MTIPMEQPAITELLPGFQPFEDSNTNPTYKGMVHIDNEPETSAFVKSLPEHEILIETLCAIIGRALDLPIPRPLLVIPTPDACPDGHDPNLPLFGSHDVQHPSARRLISPSGILDTNLLKVIEKQLLHWRQLNSAAIFDEQITNPDRHVGNLLHNGLDFYLIDHGLAFSPILNKTITSDQPFPENILFSYLQAQDEVNRKRHHHQAKRFLSKLGAVNIDIALESTLFRHYAKDKSQTKIVGNLYRRRIEHINEIVAEKLGFPDTTRNLNHDYGSW